MIPVEKTCQYRSFDEYVGSPELGNSYDNKLHIGLVPQPYFGALERASIFVLMLNPSLSPGDYFAEYNVPEFRSTLIRDLRQDNASDDYPFTFLNPQFAWHPGFRYWERKFHDIANELAKQRGLSFQDALKHIAQSVACLQLVPYHSKTFRVSALVKSLPSTRRMLNLVHNVLAPTAQQGDILLVVARGASHWNLPKHRHIIVYKDAEARSAHLTLRSRGGEAIANRLGI